MSDFEALKAMLGRAGIEFEVLEGRGVPIEDRSKWRGFRSVVIEGDQKEPRAGYTGFVSSFVFDEAGALVNVGASE